MTRFSNQMFLIDELFIFQLRLVGTPTAATHRGPAIGVATPSVVGVLTDHIVAK